MKNKTMIIVLIIVIIVILICLVLLNIINKYSNSDYYETEFENQIAYEQTNKIELLNNKNKYFAVNNILSSFISCIKEINGDMEYDTFMIEKDEAMKAFLDEGINIMNNMLDPLYKSEMNTTRQSLIQMAKKYDNYNLIIDKVYIYDKSVNIDIFIVNAFIGKQQLNIIIKTDSDNEVFSILLEDYMQKYDYNNEKIIGNIADTAIQQANENNVYEYKNITDKQMADHYFRNYMNMLKYQPNKAYELLDREYKNIKFSSYNDFERHIKEREHSLNLKEYKVLKGDKYTIYICKDKYDFIFLFKQTELMNYTVQLDDYTIKDDELIKQYEDMDELDKGANSIMQFFEMINMKDYKVAYDKLNEAFKQNNFKNEQNFEEYIKQKTFNVNNVNIKSYELETDTYIYNVTVKDALGSSTQEYIYRIIVNSLENAEFKVTFEI